MLSYNVTGLLRSAPGTSRRYEVSGARLFLGDDLQLAATIEGEVRLARTSRSILATADLFTALAEECSRCLIPIAAPIRVSLKEEALPSIDLESGQPLDTTSEPEALRLDEHHELHLEGPVRDAISLAEPIAPLCRPDCQGLCPICGVDRNAEPGHSHEDETLDPRLAELAEWRPLAGPGDRH